MKRLLFFASLLLACAAQGQISGPPLNAANLRGVVNYANMGYVPDGQTLYVNITGNDKTAVRGDKLHPYASVSGAVTNMLPGDRVEVAAGTYVESGTTFYITNGSSIEGKGMGITTIQCNAGTTPVISYKSRAANLTWNILAGGGNNGLYVNDQTGQATDATLDNVEVIATNQAGIYCLTTVASNKLDMIHCRVRAQECIHIENGGGPTLLTNFININACQFLVDQTNFTTANYGSALHFHSASWNHVNMNNNDIQLSAGTNVVMAIDPAMASFILGSPLIQITNSVFNLNGNHIWYPATNLNTYAVITNMDYIAFRGGFVNSTGNVDDPIGNGGTNFANQIQGVVKYIGGVFYRTNTANP